MGWLLSLSFLSVLFTCSVVAAQNNWNYQQNRWENSNSERNPDEQQLKGNRHGAEQDYNANPGVIKNDQRNNNEYSNGNSYAAEPDSTGQTVPNVPPAEHYPQRNWPVYHCRENNLQYDCIFHHVSIDRGAFDFSFGFEDITHNKQRQITFKNSTMRKLPAALLNSFPEVELLDLTDLQIEEIEPNAFSNGNYIRVLFMSYNYIRELPMNAFYSLRSLSTLVLDRNNLEHLPANIFSNTQNISILSIANNNLERIDDYTFQNCKELESLTLSSNKLTYIDLSRIPSLYHVNVSSNLLTTLSIPENVVELDASHNRINTVTGPNNEVLQLLRLQHNNLTDTAWLLRYSGLTMVDLSYNELEKITHQHLKNVKSLKELYLSNNRLVALHLDQQPVQSLKVLDLRHNHLLYVEKNQRQFETLEQLYLDHNSIVTLKLSTNNMLQRLTLSHNDWDCSNLEQLFQIVHVSVIGGSDRNCKPDYELKQNICCKHSDKPYLDRLIQHISFTSVAEKFQRAQGRCSATDALNSVHTLQNSMMQQGGGTLFVPNPQLQTEINQLQVDIERLSNTQYSLGNRLQGMDNEIDNTLRRYRVTKEGLVSRSENLGKLFEHLQNRRTFKEKETQTRQAEFERKKEEQEKLQRDNEELQNKLKASNKQKNDIKKETNLKNNMVKRLEAKKNNNAPTRHITK